MVIEMTFLVALTIAVLLLLLISASIYPYVRFQIWCLFRSVVWSAGQIAVGLYLFTLLVLVGWPLWM